MRGGTARRSRGGLLALLAQLLALCVGGAAVDAVDVVAVGHGVQRPVEALLRDGAGGAHALGFAEVVAGVGGEEEHGVDAAAGGVVHPVAHPRLPSRRTSRSVDGSGPPHTWRRPWRVAHSHSAARGSTTANQAGSGIGATSDSEQSLRRGSVPHVGGLRLVVLASQLVDGELW